jgi:inhibitor of cysteine peptidase
MIAGCTTDDRPLEITGEQSGSSYALVTGQELHVSLEANPTTGYEWAIDGALPAQLEQAGEPEYTSDSSATGSGGIEVWTFKAVEAGEGTLRLKYWRSFEPTVAPVDEFAVDVRVE